MTTDYFTPSPCIRKCSLDEAGTCRGCFRTLDEIRQWTTLSETEKQATVRRCQDRRRERRMRRFLRR